MTPTNKMRIIRAIRTLVTAEITRRTRVRRHTMDAKTAEQAYERDISQIKELLDETAIEKT